MNKVIRNTMALALGLVILASQSSPAQEEEIATPEETPAKVVKKDKKAKKKAKASRVATALKKVKTFNGKPNDKALVYLYLQSASWCPPCNREMPTIVETYKKMKKDGRVEIILLGHDKTDDAAKAFLKQYKAKFPGTMATSKHVSELPGFSEASGIPFAIFVDADGNVLSSGHPGSILSSWETLADKVEAAKAEAAETADGEGEEREG